MKKIKTQPVLVKRINENINTPESQNNTSFNVSITLKGLKTTREYSPDGTYLREYIILQPLQSISLRTGLIIDIPEGYIGVGNIIQSAVNKGLMLTNQNIVLESNNDKELFIEIFNRSDKPIFIEHNEELAQVRLFQLIYISLKGE
jgi:dUTPase